MVPTEIPLLSKFGGAVQKRAIELVFQQRISGEESLALSPGELDSEDANLNNFPYVFLRLNRPFRDIEYMYKARRFIKKSSDIDIVHVHGLPLMSLFLPKQVKGLLTVDYFRYRGSGNRFLHQLYLVALKKYTVIACVSEACLNDFVEFYPSVKATVIYNGVSSDQREPQPDETAKILNKYGLVHNNYVLYLGRVCEQKGSHLLAKIQEELSSLGGDLEMVAAGPLGQFGAILDSVPQKRDKNVKYLGAVHDNDVQVLLHSARVFVLPTIRDEMFGMVIPEALAQGTPVVASRLGGIPEALGDGGYLFEVGDVKECAQLIFNISEDASLRKRLSEDGMRHIQKFSWAEISNCYLHSYKV